jgi:molybdopterin synthase sulfur carrier subunit
MIKVILPYHLQQLSGSSRMVELNISGEATLNTLLDTLEADYPALRGTTRDIQTHKRRDFIRFIASGRDISLDDQDKPLPQTVIDGLDEFRIIGAMAGG